MVKWNNEENRKHHLLKIKNVFQTKDQQIISETRSKRRRFIPMEKLNRVKIVN
jgi:hypothetical protein